MTGLAERMAELGLRFRERAARDRFTLADALARGDRDTIRRTSHGLAGTAGIFGHHRLGDVAEQLELAIEHAEADEEIAARCRALLDQLDAVGA